MDQSLNMFTDDLLSDGPPKTQGLESSKLGNVEHLDFEDLDTDRSPGKSASSESPTAGKLPSSQDILTSTKDFLADLTSSAAPPSNPLDDMLSDDFSTGKDLLMSGPDDAFSFSKPLPPEPANALADFLRTEAETTRPPAPPADSPRDSPPPVPRHLSQDDSGDEFEPSHTPEPDYEPPRHDSPPPREPSPEPTPPRQPSPPPVRRPSPPLTPRPPIATPPPAPVVEPAQPPSAPVPEVPAPSAPAPSPPVTVADIGAKDLFSKLGLDAWFDPRRLHPKVESLVYWRDAKKSGVVFGVTMVSLLSLVYCSLITVVSYLCIFLLTFTMLFRIYKAFMQAVQKTTDGHPFKHLLEMDLEMSEERVRQAAEVGVKYLNASILELRRLFLVVDLVDSSKFLLCMWAMTYVGALFNGLTLIIIGVIALFTLPKVYENNKQQIDTYLELATGKVSEITNKVKTALPVGKKEEKKEQ